MSRLKDYINTDINAEAAKKIIPMLKKDCKYYLSKRRSDTPFLYRGTKPKKHGVDFEIKKRRKDRVSMSTPDDITVALDDVFFKEYGWKPRSQGVFVSGDLNSTKYYGPPYLFFPIGKFRYLWSQQIKDFFAHEYMRNYQLSAGVAKDSKEELAYRKEWVEGVVEKYQAVYLTKAIDSGNEIMFDVDKYYIVDRKFEQHIRDM